MNDINNLLQRVGNTPIISLKINEIPKLNIFAKLEFYNPTGSVKDRAASFIIKKILEEGVIDKDTTIVESSSGNFGVALSAYTKMYGLKFICVIDPHISPINEMLINAHDAQLIKVTNKDEYGGYLLSRIKKIEELSYIIPNLYWVNQYSNPLNARAYYESLGNEICNETNDEVNYVFLGVSSGGTITGVSQRVKEEYPNAKIIAVDIWGSVIFGNKASKRHIPGIGSSMVPEILKSAIIDEVVMVDEIETIIHCKKLLKDYSIFAGGSSGSVFAAINKYFSGRPLKKKTNVFTIFSDRGERYCNTIYSEEWSNDFINNYREKKELTF